MTSLFCSSGRRRPYHVPPRSCQRPSRYPAQRTDPVQARTSLSNTALTKPNVHMVWPTIRSVGGCLAPSQGLGQDRIGTLFRVKQKLHGRQNSGRFCPSAILKPPGASIRPEPNSFNSSIRPNTRRLNRYIPLLHAHFRIGKDLYA